MTDTTEPKPVAYQYRFRDPLSGNPVWRNSHAKWNGQEPDETRRLYDVETVQQLQQRCDRLLAALKRIVEGVPDYFEHDGQYGTVHRAENGVYCGFELHDPKAIIDSILGVADSAIIAESEKQP